MNTLTSAHRWATMANDESLAYMQAPSPVLAGLYVVAYAHADPTVVFEQRHTLNVNGEWLGRVPLLAICQDFETREYAIQHCSQEWEPLGIAAGYSSLDEAKSRVERSYHGIGDKWILSTTSFEDARALNEAELRAAACSFCGRNPLQYRTIIGESVRICGHCVDEFHAAIHADDSTN
jgi:hypothetical protein